MDPFSRRPEENDERDLALWRQAALDYEMVGTMTAIRKLDWNIVNLSGGPFSGLQISDMVRSWLVAAYCYLFAEWVHVGPEPVDERLTRYGLMQEWVECEIRGKYLMPSEDGTLQVEALDYDDYVHGILASALTNAIYGDQIPVAGGQVDDDEASIAVSTVINNLMDIAGCLATQKAWDGLGVETQNDARAGYEVLSQRRARDYTRSHFAEWIGRDLMPSDAAALVARVRELAPTLSEDDFEAVSVHGLDLVMDVPNEVWLQIHQALDDEGDQRMLRGLFTTATIS